MSGQNPLDAILATLKAVNQQPATSRPSLGSSGVPPHGYPQVSQNPYQTNALPYPAQNFAYPQPSSSGNIDLSAIKPVTSGTVNLNDSIADKIAQARAFAAEKGITPYDRSAYPPQEQQGSTSRRYGRSRSRSPPARRDDFRENYNSYRDERRDERGDQGRDYGRERSFSPGLHSRGGFSPRGVGASGRERSPMRGSGDDNVEIIQIESSLVGLIIGRQGENLRRVEKDSHCRVQFIPAASPEEQFRACKITGPRAQRAEAKAAINRIIEDSGMGALARAGLDKGPDTTRLKEGEDCLQIMVPDRTVGLIIGRGGETIRDLQERSGCHINIVGESKSINGLRPVNLIGTPAAAAHAKDLILEIVDSDSRSNNQTAAAGSGGGSGERPARSQGARDGGGFVGGGGDKINDSIYVPSEAVGMIIGKGGETIREMQNSTGCKINVSQSSGPGETEREIGLIGSRDSINRAKRAIEDKVELVRQKNSGGGGGGGGGRRGPPRDYDSTSYGQTTSAGNASGQPAQAVPPAGQASSGDAADPYAIYGGYQNYVALWYQSYAQQAAEAAQGQAHGDGKPPGTT